MGDWQICGKSVRSRLVGFGLQVDLEAMCAKKVLLIDHRESVQSVLTRTWICWCTKIEARLWWQNDM
jgi:hypothetical protein